MSVNIGKRGQQRKGFDGTKQLDHNAHQRRMIGILDNTANASRRRGKRGNG